MTTVERVRIHIQIERENKRKLEEWKKGERDNVQKKVNGMSTPPQGAVGSCGIITELRNRLLRCLLESLAQTRRFSELRLCGKDKGNADLSAGRGERKNKMLRYGIPKVDRERRICFNCEHWTKDERPKSGWGNCALALNSGLFKNHTSHGSYVARHTNSRYYNQTGCKIRFKRRTEK